MNVRTMRFLKEARPMLWAWCAIALLAGPRLMHPYDWALAIWAIGYFFGIPLLAALPFGNEFQHRTLSLLLSQPVGRIRIWSEKLSISVVAAVSAALVLLLALRTTSFLPDGNETHVAEAWIVATIASATFWTLIARSTVGGVALTMVVQLFLYLPVDLVRWRYGIEYLSFGSTISIPTITFVFLCYAGVMLWLGWRRLARFQVTGGMAGDDLLTAGPDVMPGALVGWLRCRPTGPIVNLIRKELRLLRPVWLITLLAAVGWIGLTVFGLVHERGSTSPFTLRVASVNWPAVVWIVGVTSTLIVAILAGSLSLGEERTSGTHAWHMTLPVSALRQWSVKLFIGLFAGLMGAALIPMLLLVAGGSLFGSPFKFVEVNFGIFWLVVVLLLSFASFWCACAAKGTVSAVLWVFPAVIAVGLAGKLGVRAGGELINYYISRFDPFADFKFATTVMAWPAPFIMLYFQPLASYLAWFEGSAIHIGLTLAVLCIPTAILAIIQSYRLFRAQVQDGTLSLVRNLAPLALLAFLCSFSLAAYSAFVDSAAWEVNGLIFDTHNAIEKILPDAGKLGAAQPLQLTVDDLAKAGPFRFGKSTQRRLRDSRITVTPNTAHPSDYCCGGNSNKFMWWFYSATIHLASESDITLSFKPGQDGAKFPGRLHAYVHRQGAVGQEEVRVW